MKDYVKLTTNKDFGSISVSFNVKQEKVAAIGKKMHDINELANMNGHNWEALLNYYLEANYADLAGGMGTDADAGKYVAMYKLNPANEKKAAQLAAIIEELVENESRLYEIIKSNADEIDWD